jgi:hypothetical protein
MTKNTHAVALGELGGKKGGKSRSKAKVEAVRINIKKAQEARKQKYEHLRSQN